MLIVRKSLVVQSTYRVPTNMVAPLLALAICVGLMIGALASFV